MSEQITPSLADTTELTVAVDAAPEALVAQEPAGPVDVTAEETHEPIAVVEVLEQQEQTDVAAEIVHVEATSIVDQAEEAPAQAQAQATEDNGQPSKRKKKPKAKNFLADPQAIKPKKEREAPELKPFSRPLLATQVLADLKKKLTRERKDGETDINLNYRNAKTKLGQALSLEGSSFFVHPELGHFASVAGFAYFASRREPDDALRTMYGTRLRMYVQQKGYTLDNSPEMRLVTADALWVRLNQNQELRAQVLGNSLPFAHYQCDEAGVVVERPGAQWIVQAYDAMVKALRAQEAGDAQAQPNFQFMLKSHAHQKKADQGQRRSNAARPHKPRRPQKAAANV